MGRSGSCLESLRNCLTYLLHWVTGPAAQMWTGSITDVEDEEAQTDVGRPPPAAEATAAAVASAAAALNFKLAAEETKTAPAADTAAAAAAAADDVMMMPVADDQPLGEALNGNEYTDFGTCLRDAGCRAQLGHLRDYLCRTQHIQHPTASLLNFLLASAAAATDAASLKPAAGSNHHELQIPSDCKQLLSDSQIRTFMAAAAEEYYGIPASARHYVIDLPLAELIAPCISRLMTAASSPAVADTSVMIFDVGMGEDFAALDSLLQQPATYQQQAPAVLLLHAPDATREVAAMLRLAPQMRDAAAAATAAATAAVAGEAAAAASACACSAGRAGAGDSQPLLQRATQAGNMPSRMQTEHQWLLLDPSGDFEWCFVTLQPGPFYLHPASTRSQSAKQSASRGTELSYQQHPGTSAAHVLFGVLGHITGLLDLQSVPQFVNSYNHTLSGLCDADYGVSCLATLLVEGRVSIGLLGISLGSSMQCFDPVPHIHDNRQHGMSIDVQGAACCRAAAANAAATGLHVARTSADLHVDEMLRAWQHVVQHGNSHHTPSATWVDLHNLADILHHIDGYVSSDGHLFFVSCHNMARDANCRNLASSDISLPLYQQQKMRWLSPCSSACSFTTSNPCPAAEGAETAAMAQNHTAVLGCSELTLHYSGAHYTLSILNHQHKVLLYFDSLGGTGNDHWLPTPPAYETVILSKRTQSTATCGPQALFVALAYVADFQGLRSACSAGMAIPAAAAMAGQLSSLLFPQLALSYRSCATSTAPGKTVRKGQRDNALQASSGSSASSCKKQRAGNGAAIETNRPGHSRKFKPLTWLCRTAEECSHYDPDGDCTTRPLTSNHSQAQKGGQKRRLEKAEKRAQKRASKSQGTSVSIADCLEADVDLSKGKKPMQSAGHNKKSPASSCSAAAAAATVAIQGSIPMTSEAAAAAVQGTEGAFAVNKTATLRRALAACYGPASVGAQGHGFLSWAPAGVSADGLVSAVYHVAADFADGRF